MSTAFHYRPKFVDVRVNKPDPEAPQRAPEERACDRVGCRLAGLHRAPKGRGCDGEYWWFCLDHAGEYNRGYNYFAGMSEEELMAHAEAEIIGHRPTWSFKAGSRDRLFAASRARGRKDPFGMFGHPEAEAQTPRRPRVSRTKIMALECLGLAEGASPEEVRARYAELVKRFHPDANGGDRTHEAHLHRVIRAFQALKATGAA